LASGVARGLFLFGNQSQNFAVFREMPFSFFGKNQLAVYFDFENPASGCNKFALHTTMIFYGSGQTGRLGFIVSNHAVFDADAHAVTPRTE